MCLVFSVFSSSSLNAALSPFLPHTGIVMATPRLKGLKREDTLTGLVAVSTAY